MDAARRQDCHFLPQTYLLHEKCRVKPRGRESENVPNKNETNQVKVFIHGIKRANKLSYATVVILASS